ncbi:MAG: hypothetical protein NTZ68_02550 [Candidatus Dependentiae bacterium]|nr:hypothetical protein [Candidatus Dependentiae bacterium]
MKKLLAFFLVCVSGNVLASSVSNGVCNATMCHRASVANSDSTTVAIIATLLMQCFVFPATPADQSRFVSTSYVSLKNNSQAVVVYRKEELGKNIKLRRNGALKQPKK